MASNIRWKRQGPAYEAGCRTAANELRRSLVRLANIAGADVALVLRTRSGHGGFARVAGVALGDANADELVANATNFPMRTPPDVDALADDARMMIHWLSMNGRGGFALVLARGPKQVPFHAASLNSLSECCEWLEDIVGLWWKSERGAARASALCAALETGETGVVLLNCRGAVVEANANAARLLKQSAGLMLRGDRMAAEIHADDRALQAAILAVMVAAGCGKTIEPVNIAVHRRDNRLPLSVTVSQSERRPATYSDYSDPVVLLQIVDPGADHITAAASCALFALTPAEVRLTDQIVAGRSVNEAAAALGLSIETARTYLKRVFTKTGVNRQASLVRLVLSSRLPMRRTQRRAAVRGSRSPDQKYPVDDSAVLALTEFTADITDSEVQLFLPLNASAHH